jgi:hypothetical protein
MDTLCPGRTHLGKTFAVPLTPKLEQVVTNLFLGSNQASATTKFFPFSNSHEPRNHPN